MAYTNPGPATAVTQNLQSPYSTEQFIQTIAVSITPTAVSTVTAPEQSYGLNGATFATAATGIKPGDVIIDVSPPSVTAGVALASTRVDTSTTDKFYFQWVNPTAGSLTPPSGIYLITVARFNSGSSVTPATLSSLPTSLG